MKLRAEKSLENVTRLRSERDDLAHSVADLEKRLEAALATDLRCEHCGETYQTTCGAELQAERDDLMRRLKQAEREREESRNLVANVCKATTACRFRSAGYPSRQRLNPRTSRRAGAGLEEAVSFEELVSLRMKNSDLRRQLATANERIAELEEWCQGLGLHISNLDEQITAARRENARLRKVMNE